MTITASTTNTATEIWWCVFFDYETTIPGASMEIIWRHIIRWTRNTVQGGTDGHIRALGHRIGSAPAGGA
jgi:hypothetical protein